MLYYYQTLRWDVVYGEIKEMGFCVGKEKSCHVLQYADVSQKHTVYR